MQKILLVDDDEALRQSLARALQKRGYEVSTAADYASANQCITQDEFDAALVDLKLPDRSGLHVIQNLRQHDPELPIVMLTGYSSVATAVEAIKLGAMHYLSKPATVNEILAAFARVQGEADVEHVDTLSVDRVEWEHIQRVLHEHDGNISAAARALKMHRRTLQRKLAKRPVKE